MNRSTTRSPLASLLQLAVIGATLAPAVFAQAAPPAPVEPKLEPKAKVIYLMRHGHYANDPGADPVLGPGLTSIGVAQARLAGARLAGLPEKFDAIYASPMTRARETARVVADDLGMKIQVVETLAECTPPTWRSAVVSDEKPEEMAACSKTLDAVFAERFRPAEGAERRELLVCHGNVIRSLVVRALKVDPMAWLEMSVSHASLTKIRVEPDGTFKIIAVGDSGHLPPNLLTGSTGDPDRSLAVPAEP